MEESTVTGKIWGGKKVVLIVLLISDFHKIDSYHIFFVFYS